MFAQTQDLEFGQGQSRDVPDRELGPNITMLVYLNTYITIIQYMFVKYYLRFVVLISSEDLVTDISPTYNLHT